jgi:hypothetical protein
LIWADLYPWLLVFHVLSVLAFLAIHGVSMGVWWRVRRERDRAKLMAWFELSGSFVMPMLASGLLLIVSGVLVGVAAGWWFNGQWWLWVSIVLLAAIVQSMNSLNAIPLVEMRRGLGIPSRADHKAGTVPTPVDDATLDALLRDRRPLAGSVFAITGIVVITWLMETKPF